MADHFATKCNTNLSDNVCFENISHLPNEFLICRKWMNPRIKAVSNNETQPRLMLDASKKVKQILNKCCSSWTLNNLHLPSLFNILLMKSNDRIEEADSNCKVLVIWLKSKNVLVKLLSKIILRFFNFKFKNSFD